MKQEILVILSVTCGIIFISSAYASRYKITDDKAIAAIVGEYAEEDDHGMRLIAHAIRNRGHLRGVYGLNAKHSKYESRKIWVLAATAWFESAYEPDPLKGADSWWSKDDVKKKGFPKGWTYSYFWHDRKDAFHFFKSTQNRR